MSFTKDNIKTLAFLYNNEYYLSSTNDWGFFKHFSKPIIKCSAPARYIVIEMHANYNMKTFELFLLVLARVYFEHKKRFAAKECQSHLDQPGSGKKDNSDRCIWRWRWRLVAGPGLVWTGLGCDGSYRLFAHALANKCKAKTGAWIVHQMNAKCSQRLTESESEPEPSTHTHTTSTAQCNI